MKRHVLAVLGDAGTAVDISSWRGPGTKVIDAGGKLVLPGFNDSHAYCQRRTAAGYDIGSKTSFRAKDFLRLDNSNLV